MGFLSVSYICFREEVSSDFDSYYDARKLFGNATKPHVFSYGNFEENEKLAINTFPPPFSGDMVHLRYRIGLEEDYTLSFTE